MGNEETLERIKRLESLIEEQQATIEQQRERLSQLETGNDDSPQVVLDGGSVKIIGEISADDATGVKGKATGSGSTVGVRGEATNGYGLSTPDDAKVGGRMEVERIRSASELIGDVDGDEVMYLTDKGPSGEAGNVFFGMPANYILSLAAESPAGATVSGGGKSNSNVTKPNVVYDDFGAVGGGLDNQVGEDDENETTSRGATIGGGEANRAMGKYALVAGGKGNKATARGAAVPGGQNNDASGKHSLAVGRQASADHDGAVVVGDATSTEVSSATSGEMRVQQDVTAEGDLQARSVSKDKVGAKMTLGFKQTFPSDGNRRRIKFDTVRFDHFGWADTTNHVFSVDGPATLLIGGNPSWFLTGNGQDYGFEILKNGNVIASLEVGGKHSGIPTDYMSMLTQVSAGTTNEFSMQARIEGSIDRDLENDRGENEFWIIKQG